MERRRRVVRAIAAFIVVSLGQVGSGAAQPWLEGRRWRGPSTRDVRCEGSQGALPAGLYYRELGYELELPCPMPAAAVALGVHRSVAAARADMPRARALSAGPGYPWVVHSRHAALDADGIAIVLGLFATRDAAERFRAGRSELRVLTVLGEAAGPDRDPRRDHVTHVLAAAPVPAYRTEDVERIENAWNDTAETITDWRRHRRAFRAERAARLAAAPVACRIDPDALFLSDDRPEELPVLGDRSWEPVECGGELAWIALEQTASTAVIFGDREGRTSITQVSLVECDVPTYTTWELLPDGARRNPRIAAPGC